MQILEPSSKREWEDYYKLRWEVLRKPLGLKIGSEKDELEYSSIHRAIKINRKIIAVGRLHFLDSKIAQIRYMGVNQQYHNQGLGGMIIKEFEKISNHNNISKMILYSRESAVKFYENKGFEKIDKAHKLEGIQHFLMEKTL